MNLNVRRVNDGEGTKGAVGFKSWFKNVESKLNITKCTNADKVKYVARLLQGRALTWWNTQVQTRGRDAANRLTWDNFKSLLIKENYRKDEVQKLESEFWNHHMFGTEVDKYIACFHEFAKMVPYMVSTEEKRIDQYIWGLIPKIRMIVTSSNPTTLQATVGHFAKACKNREGNGNDGRRPSCYECGSLDHLQDVFPSHYVSILFDSGADRSFVSLEIRPLLEQKSDSLKEIYIIEYANGHEYEARVIMLDCKLNLNGDLFNIDLIPIELKSFDVDNKTFMQGEKPARDLKIISAIKMRKYLKRYCFAFLAHVVEKDQKVKSIQDIPVVRNYPEVFLKDLPGPPPSRQVEL
ncbi:putative reverse transcriptase domain-containing protein [Tanacetum coccineum]